MTRVNSPRGSAKCATASLRVPRNTSSNFFVSSRQTATRRSPRASRRAVRLARRRWGDSKATMARESSRRAAKRRRRSPARRGGGPRGGERGGGAAGAGEAAVQRGGHQVQAGVADDGRAALGDGGDVAFAEGVQQAGDARRLVVVVVR